MSSIGRGLLACSVGALLCGCAASLERTDKIATDYNRVFAKARNEAILLNVLRAWGREPLQFSTISQVSGGVRSTAGVTLPFNNILLGGDAAINPSISLGGGPNPTVTIIPLSSKEFTQGILRPIPPETLDYFLSQGWERELVLPLVVGGVGCTNGSVVINRGRDPYLNWDFFQAAQKGGGFTIGQTSPQQVAQLRMTAEKAAALMKDGPGEGRVITAVDPYENWLFRQRNPGANPPSPRSLSGDVVVTVSRKGAPQIQGLSVNSVCSEFELQPSAGGEAASPAQGENKSAASYSAPVVSDVAGKASQSSLVIRSVEAIIYYLAEIHAMNVEEDVHRCGLKRPDAQPSLRLLDAKARAEALRADLRAARDHRAVLQSRGASADEVAAADRVIETMQLLVKDADSAVEAGGGGQVSERLRALAAPSKLFKVHMTCDHEAPPLTTAVKTEFQGRDYYILPAGAADPGDRTLEVLSFLSDLIALQTSEATIQAASPVIAITQQ